MMKFWTYTFIQLKILFRVPIGVFFTIIFPQLMLFVFVFMSQNNQVAEEIYFVDVYLPVAMLLSMFSSGIISFAVIVSGNKKQKIWQLYRLKGFSTWELILGETLVNLFLCLISSSLLIISAYTVFGARIPSVGKGLTFVFVWVVICLLMFLIGAVIGVMSPNENVAQSVSTVLMFVLLILSGIMVDLSQLPQLVQDISYYLPTTQANNILVNYWIGGTNEINWLVIILWGIFLCLIISLKENYIPLRGGEYHES